MHSSHEVGARAAAPGADVAPQTTRPPSSFFRNSRPAGPQGKPASGDSDAPTDGARVASSLAALCLIARLHHVAAEPAQLCHALGWPASHQPNSQDFLLAAKHLGLKATLIRSAPERLTLTPLPALALIRDDAGTVHTVVLAQCDGQRVLFQDPSGAIQGGRPVIEPLEVFQRQWSGKLILIASRASIAGELARFDFSWFIPSLVKYRKLLGEVLVVSLFLQLFGLVSPLFFQVVMDKVLVHKGHLHPRRVIALTGLADQW